LPSIINLFRMRRIIFALCTLLLVQTGWTQSTPPSNLSGQSLRTWLKSNWYDGYHTTSSYTTSKAKMYKSIDKKDDNKIHCVYSNFTIPPTSGSAMPMNCEHTVPQSFFNKAQPMRSDLHHLYPTHERVNGARGHLPFAEIPDSQTDKWYIYSGGMQSGSSIPSSDIDSYSELNTNVAFEPREDHKGNVARSVFYFYTMYPTQAGNISKIGDINTLYEWHINDPVDEWEITRNTRIKTEQGNSNPYVEYPELVAKAWGFVTTPKVETPSISPNGGNISSATDVTITCGTTGATIYYTTDGSNPTTSSTQYTMPFTVSKTTTVKAIGVKSGIDNSYTASATFTYNSGGTGDSKVIFEEDFESFNESSLVNKNGWFSKVITGDIQWTIKTYNKNKYAEMKIYPKTGSYESWLITPALDLSTYKSIEFSFRSKDSHDKGQTLFVMVSTNYNSALDGANGDWTDLNPTIASGSTSGYASNYTESGTIDLSSYKGQTIYIGFKYIGANPGKSTTMQIDDIEVKGVKNDGGTPDKVASPTFTPDGGSFNGSTNVSLSCATNGAKIYYTTDGSVPSDSDNLYSSPISVTSSTTIKAVAIKTGLTNSDIITKTFTINTTPGKVASPTFTPDGGSFNGSTNVSLSCATAGAKIYYTTDGSEPSDSDNLYSSAINITSTTTIKAIAIKTGLTNSDIITKKFTINNTPGKVSSPTFSPDGGSFNVSTNVSISCATAGAKIYYTTDGSEPSDSDNLYSSAININSTTTIKAIAVKSGMTNSDIVTKTFTINGNTNNIIENVKVIPTSPSANEKVHVIVTLKSGSTAKNVVIKYSTSADNNEKSINMALNNNKYEAEIPGQSGGVTVTYKIEATDNNNKSSSLTGNYKHKDGGTDVKDGNKLLLRVHPNPASDKLYIQSSDTDNNLNIHIYTMQGKLVINRLNNNSNYIDISKLKPGVYLIVADTGSQKTQIKFIKQ
jgi:hypothetical protein